VPFSTSLPVRVTLPLVSSFVVSVFGWTVGRSFTEVTLIVTVAVLENPLAPTVLAPPSRTR
jgi:hypothetical protein